VIVSGPRESAAERLGNKHASGLVAAIGDVRLRWWGSPAAVQTASAAGPFMWGLVAPIPILDFVLVDQRTEPESQV
jgi:hypothetical protein